MPVRSLRAVNSLRSSIALPSAPPTLRHSEPAMTEVLKIEGLSAGYGPLRVIHDLDLVIHPGERVGIVGLNGHGKTTLFYAIAGLTGWQRGSIVLNGKQIGRTRSQGPGRYTHQIVRQGLAIMPQGDEI